MAPPVVRLGSVLGSLVSLNFRCSILCSPPLVLVFCRSTCAGFDSFDTGKGEKLSNRQAQPARQIAWLFHFQC